MGKVSVGLRGWRFDEDEIFDEFGNYRPVDEMPEDTRKRLIRLAAVFNNPCDACWLIHGDENVEQCNVAEVVYGEPLAEVLLCGDHEADFHWWYAEAGGEQYRGTERFQDAFHEWFAAGNRAPEFYDGPEHVDTDPAEVPRPPIPDQAALTVELPEEEQVRIDFREMKAEEGGEVQYVGDDAEARAEAAETADGDAEGDEDAADEDDEEDLDLGDLDLDADYPGS